MNIKIIDRYIARIRLLLKIYYCIALLEILIAFHPHINAGEAYSSRDHEIPRWIISRFYFARKQIVQIFRGWPLSSIYYIARQACYESTFSYITRYTDSNFAHAEQLGNSSAKWVKLSYCIIIKFLWISQILNRLVFSLWFSSLNLLNYHSIFELEFYNIFSYIIAWKNRIL